MQSMVRAIQGTLEKVFICLFHQLDNVWHIRRTVVNALTSPYERIDLLKIGAGYEAPPHRRRVRQPRHHDCPKDSLQACVIHAIVAEDTQGMQRLRTVTDNTADVLLGFKVY